MSVIEVGSGPAGGVEVDVAVLGAGPAGLSAAWYAARRGCSVQVIDRAGHVGGLAASLCVAGQRVDLGSHRLHSSIDAALLADLRELLGEDLQRTPRHGRILLGGRWVAFPLRPLDLARRAPPTFAARALFDLATARRRRYGDVDDFAASVRAGMGPAIATAFYEPYARKLWGVDPELLSAELYRRRVPARRASTVVGQMLRRRDPPGFWYPAGGFGQISECLAQAIVSLGGVLSLTCELRRVRPGTDAVTVEARTAAGSMLTLRAHTVVSTIPGHALAELAGAPDAVRAAAAQLQHRAAVLVYLVVPRPRYTQFDAHYFPGDPARIARLSEPKAYRRSDADPRDRTVLCAELPATVGDAVWQATDADLAAQVRADLIAAGLPDPAPSSFHVERRTHVYPVYRVGFEQARRRVEEWVAGTPGLVTLGRQALFAHDNTHHALAMGAALGRCLDASGRVDAAAWRTASAAFTDHVVED